MSDKTELKMTDFVLDGFLEWLVDECDQRRESYTICSTRDQFGRFEMVWVQTSWIAWQASRAALVVELPKPWQTNVGAMLTPNGVRFAIEAAGLKVKP